LSQDEIKDLKDMTPEEIAEHDFISEQLEDEEIMDIALACENTGDIIATQFFFAHKKSEQAEIQMKALKMMAEDRLIIESVKDGIPTLKLKNK